MIAAALDVDRAEVGTPWKQSGSGGPSRQTLGSGMPGFGTWNSTLRSWLSICSSFLYCGSPPSALEDRATPTCAQQVGVAEREVERDHEHDQSVLVLDLDPLRPRSASSCAAVYVPSGALGSSSPWIMLCAR